MSITHSELVQLFVYDNESGALYWRHSGRKAGTNYHGYLKVCVHGKRYYAHRIVWNLVTGRWPDKSIDHADLNRSNNKFGNLREVSHSLNMRNCRVRSHNKCGLKGSSPKGNKFRAQISIDGRTKFIGTFNSPEEAHAAYLATAKRMFGDFARAA
jgi:hypothetical protein